MKPNNKSNVVLRFAAQLKALRQQRGLSQRQLAKELQVTPRSVLFYEQGKTMPSIEVAARVARLFEVSTDDLIFASTKRAESIHDRELIESLAVADGFGRRDRALIKDLVEALAAKYESAKIAPART